MNANCNIYNQPMRGDARRYPDAMTLAQAAEYLNVSTKLVSKLIRDEKFYAKKSRARISSFEKILDGIRSR